MISPEPRFARVAALIADPSRARMLALLLGGEARTAGVSDFSRLFGAAFRQGRRVGDGKDRHALMT